MFFLPQYGELSTLNVQGEEVNLSAPDSQQQGVQGKALEPFEKQTLFDHSAGNIFSVSKSLPALLSCLSHSLWWGPGVLSAQRDGWA